MTLLRTLRKRTFLKYVSGSTAIWTMILLPNTIPAAVLVIAKYQYQAAFVADQEINMLACLTEIMIECEFK